MNANQEMTISQRDKLYKLEWTADAKIRAEFPDEATYLAFRRAEDRGVVSVHCGNVVVAGSEETIR